MSLTIRVLGLCAAVMLSAGVQAKCNNPLDFQSRGLHSSEVVDFCEAFDGKVLLVVNTASQCGFTGQFEGLEALYLKYKDQNFAIVGMAPSWNFNKYLISPDFKCVQHFGSRTQPLDSKLEEQIVQLLQEAK